MKKLNCHCLNYLQTLLLVFLLTSACNATELNVKKSPKPNIIVILADAFALSGTYTFGQ